MLGPLEWISTQYCEEAQIPGVRNAACVAVVQRRPHGKTPLPTVVVLGSAAGVHCLSSNNSRHVISRLLLPLRPQEQVLQALEVCEGGPCSTSCLLVLALSSPHYHVTVYGVDPWKTLTTANAADVAKPMLLHTFTFAHIMPLRLFGVPFQDGDGESSHKIICSFINYSVGGDNANVGLTNHCRVFSLSWACRAELLEGTLATDEQARGIFVDETDEVNGDDSLLSCLWWKAAQLPAPPITVDHCAGLTAFGCIDGSVVVTSHLGLRAVRRFSGPVGMVKFFHPSVQTSADEGAALVDAAILKTSFARPPPDDPSVRLAVLDTVGSVMIFSATAASTPTPETLLQSVTRLRDCERTFVLPLPSDLIKDTAALRDNEAAPDLRSEAALNAPGGAGTATSKQSWIALGREKFASLVRKEAMKRDCAKRTAGATTGSHAHPPAGFGGDENSHSSLLGHSPAFGSSAHALPSTVLGASSGSSMCSTPMMQASAYLYSSRHIAETVGCAISQGPVALAVADFDSDGKNEIVVSTMGRMLAWCREDADSIPTCTYAVVEVVKMPTQMYFISLIDLFGNGEDVCLLCGPEHVLVCQRHHADTATTLISHRIALLEQLGEVAPVLADDVPTFTNLSCSATET